MSGFDAAEHDRMIANMLQRGVICAVDLPAARCRIQIGDWVSAMLPWVALAAGQARHWRAPSIGEQATLFAASGGVEAGWVLVGLYGASGVAPDNRDHVDVWRFPDGGSLVYDWQARSYTMTLPAGGTLVAQVGNTSTQTVEGRVTIDSAEVECTGNLTVNGKLTFLAGLAGSGGAGATMSISGAVQVNGDITASGTVMDGGGNSNHHSH